MPFHVTNEHQILAVKDDRPAEPEKDAAPFTSLEELRARAAAWPMQRLVDIWNRLPEVRPVKKFENRNIATARIWRAIEQDAQQHRARVRPFAIQTAEASGLTFRAGSKAAQICILLDRPQGATLDEIRTLTGWQAHTIRGFISRALRKQGLKVLSAGTKGDRIYRLMPARSKAGQGLPRVNPSGETRASAVPQSPPPSTDESDD